MMWRGPAARETAKARALRSAELIGAVLSIAGSACGAKTGLRTPEVPTFLLTVSRSGDGTVTSTPGGIACGTTCSARYPIGTTVSLFARPACSSFLGWSGACGTSTTCTVAMSQDQNVAAAFTRTPSTGDVLWARVFGGQALGMAVAGGPSDGVIAAVSLMGTADFGGREVTANSDILIVSYSQTGELLRLHPLNVPEGARGSAMDLRGNGDAALFGLFRGTVDFGGGPITATGAPGDRGNLFVVKYSGADGRHLWSRGLPGWGGVVPADIAADPEGNVVIVGWVDVTRLDATIDFGRGPETDLADAAFIASYLRDGSLRWSRILGGLNRGGIAGANAVATDLDGDVLVAGFFGYTVDFGGGPLTAVGDGDIFLAKYSAQGAHLWSRRFGGNLGGCSCATADAGLHVSTDVAGNVALTGKFEERIDFGGGAATSAGSTDGFVAMFSSAGAQLWSRTFGGADADYGGPVALDPGGNVIATGRFGGTVDLGHGPMSSLGRYDFFVAKYLGSNGTLVWSHRLGGELGEDVTAVATNESCDIVLTGAISGSFDSSWSAQTAGGFILRLMP